MFHKFQTLLLVIFTLYSFHAKSQTQYTITGKVQQTSPYCGGAKPSQEVIDNFAQAKPFANKTFYIRKGNTNNPNNKIITQFTTDSNGNFSFKLPRGTFSILVEEQVKPINAKDYTTKFQKVDNQCLQAWWLKPYHLLNVKSKNKPLNFIFNHRCYIKNDIPCITYTGPKHP